MGGVKMLCVVPKDLGKIISSDNLLNLNKGGLKQLKNPNMKMDMVWI